ncbi:hypothetical protein M3Y98_00682100 [Aphelenchoides besseyi]|nr:hypothetical protein M3Y98_00682100 [Aphelenchoides besseyi]KAI6209077.1 hypothetical protein M3Y96_00182700 [Aphelenchoides besseyi]
MAFQPNMTVRLKMEITTSGTHNGLFVTTGFQNGLSILPPQFVHQPPNQPISFTPLPIESAAKSASLIEIADDSFARESNRPETSEAPPTFQTTAQNHSDTQQTAQTARSAATPQHFDNRHQTTQLNEPTRITVNETLPRKTEFAVEHEETDDFLRSLPIKINTFEERPYVQQPSDYVLNDTTTTTTTVEVFRAASDDTVDFYKLPPAPLDSEQNEQLVRAKGPAYEVHSNTQTRFSDLPTMRRVQFDSEPYDTILRKQCSKNKTEILHREVEDRPLSRKEVSFEDDSRLPSQMENPELYRPQSRLDRDYQTERTASLERWERPSRSETPAYRPSRRYEPQRRRQSPLESPILRRRTTATPRLPWEYKKSTSKRSDGAENVVSREDGQRFPPRSTSLSPVDYYRPHLVYTPKNDQLVEDDYYAKMRDAQFRRMAVGSQRRSRSPSPWEWEEHPESPNYRMGNRSVSPNGRFKLYQTRDCLGNVLYEFTPKETSKNPVRVYASDKLEKIHQSTLRPVSQHSEAAEGVNFDELNNVRLVADGSKLRIVQEGKI